MGSSPAYLDPIVIRLLTGETVLDVACGLGRWGHLIRCNSWEAGYPVPPKVDGLDAFAPNVELCARQGCYGRVWQHLLPKPIEGQWDTVLACEVLEHLPQAEVDQTFAVLEAAARRRVIVSTPNWPAYRDGPGNPYEAHLSYIPRDELSVRGYTLIGAGFGHPGNELTTAITNFDHRLKDILQSLSRPFPALAETIVAYKDIGPRPSAALANFTLHDLRIPSVNGQTLVYAPDRLRFVMADAVTAASPVFFIQGRLCFAVSALHGLFTFTAEGNVHGGTGALNAWEMLHVGQVMTTSHGSDLRSYCDLPPNVPLGLIPPPLDLMARDWTGTLLKRLTGLDGRIGAPLLD